MRLDPSLKERAIALRMEGKSYSQIKKELGLASKGTLSAWFRNMQLPTAVLELLEKNIIQATERGLLRFNSERSERISAENKNAESEGRVMVGRLSERELMLIGASLYWGEGTKSFGENKTARLVFTNSEVGMVKVFLRFAREILQVPEERIRGELHVHDNIDRITALNYWIEATGISESRIWVGSALSSASKQKRPKNRLPFGTFSVRIPNRLLFFKVKGMMHGIASQEQSI